MRFLFFILSAFVIISCAYAPKSAYESGWNNDMSNNIYKECAPVWLEKDVFVPQNLNRLVQLKLLSDNDAGRVKVADLRTGDSECLIYATYGLNRSKVKFVINKEKQLISKTVTYSCKNSQVKCPGEEIKIIDGKISTIKELPN